MASQRESAHQIELLRMMIRIRVCEEALVAPILSGEIQCPVHLCSGQEAIAAGVCAALRDTDFVFGTHRSHGHYLAKGGDLAQMVAEIFCREAGCARGRGGSMHVIAPEVGMLGAAPIVAGTISLAVGAAYASWVRDDHAVAVAFFGDGATGEGVLYESLNLASLYKLPVIFVCENNLYSTHLPIRDCRASDRVVSVTEPFGIWSRQVDGNDAVAVLEAATSAVERCREGNGPAFLECLTYRMRGHVGPDDNIQGSHTDIRPPAEVARWRQRDPINLLARTLQDLGHLATAELAEIQSAADNEVEKAIEAARTSPFPRAEEVMNHVYQG